MKTPEWIARGDEHVLKTYGRYPLVAASGAGCRLTDVDGKEYLDFLAGVAVNNLGHCHPRVVTALQEQAGRLLHCSNFYHIPQQIELAELLCAHSFGDKVFFCNSGAEANEAAMKLVRKYSSGKFDGNKFGGSGVNGRTEIITADASFHGRTIGAISATGQYKVKDGFEPLTPGYVHVPFGDIGALREALTPRTCAIMLEPVQGEGGVNVPPAGYLQAVRQLCDEKELLLIFDEIQTGCGRTGTLFAYQQEGVEPDVMTLAKALASGPPIGALVVKDEYAVLGPGSHGSTFGGNPLMTAAGIATLKTLLEDDVLANCRAMGTYFHQQLLALKEKYSFVADVRGRGLIIGMELTIDGAEIVVKAMERGLLINCTVGKVLRFVPPLIVSKDEIDEAVGTLDGILSEIDV